MHHFSRSPFSFPADENHFVLKRTGEIISHGASLDVLAASFFFRPENLFVLNLFLIRQMKATHPCKLLSSILYIKDNI